MHFSTVLYRLYYVYLSFLVEVSMIQPDVDVSIAKRFAQSVLTWDEGVQLGITYREERDMRSWDLGWLCLYLNKEDEHSLVLFANSIGEAIGTMRRLRWVASGFTPEGVEGFPSLSFSHFEVVRRLIGKRDGDGDIEAMSFLEQAADNNWSVDALRRKVDGIEEDEGEQIILPRFVAMGTRGVRLTKIGQDEGLFIPFERDEEMLTLIREKFASFSAYDAQIVEVSIRIPKP